MVTHIWTSWNGTKTPIHLMNNEYLTNAYVRCLEVVCAENFKEKKVFNGAGHVLREMGSEVLTKEKAEKWVGYFKEEFEKRKLNLPKLDRTNIDFQYIEKQFRKQLALERNRKFSEKFK